MRALLLLLLVAASFFLVVRFYPSSAVEGAGEPAPAVGGEPAAEAPVVPLERPAGIAPPAAASERSAAAVETPATRPAVHEPAAVAPAEESVPTWLQGIEAPAPRSTGEVPVSSAVLHGSVADVRQALRGHPDFPAARAGLAEAFTLALEGDARAGLETASRLDESALTGRERELLQVALGDGSPGPRTLEAGATESPLTLAMEMRLLSREADRLLAERSHAAASRALSDLLLAELDAPWPASAELLTGWTAALDEAQANHRWHPRGGWPAIEITVEPGDTPIHVRKRYLAQRPGSVMCAGLITAANGVRGYIQPDQVLRVPTDPVRMLVDLEARWALYLMGDEVAASWPVGIGREGEETPRGEYVARNKIENPSWMRTGFEPIPYGDPRNPLGTRWIGWYDGEAKTSYGFHGTWEPESVGKPSSDGCIRFRNEDVERLFEILPEGSAIVVR